MQGAHVGAHERPKRMLVLHIVSTLILLCLAWDVHRGTRQLIAHTDELLRRVPPTT